jgi:hypothetical protein
MCLPAFQVLDAEAADIVLENLLKEGSWASYGSAWSKILDVAHFLGYATWGHLVSNHHKITLKLMAGDFMDGITSDTAKTVLNSTLGYIHEPSLLSSRLRIRLNKAKGSTRMYGPKEFADIDAMFELIRAEFENKSERAIRRRLLALLKLDLCCRQDDLAKISAVDFIHSGSDLRDGAVITVTGSKQLRAGVNDSIVWYIPRFIQDPAICVVQALEDYLTVRLHPYDEESQCYKGPLFWPLKEQRLTKGREAVPFSKDAIRKEVIALLGPVLNGETLVESKKAHFLRGMAASWMMRAGCGRKEVLFHMALKSDSTFDTHYDFQQGIPLEMFSRARALHPLCAPALFLRRNQIYLLETFHGQQFPESMFLPAMQ